MTIESRALGRIDIDQRQIITFPRGILGFENFRSFALLDASQPPFYWLQSIDEPSIAFVLISPDVFRDDYELSLMAAEMEVIGVTEDENGDLLLSGDNGDDSAELLVFAIVTVTGDKTKMSANLQGPVIINSRDRLGMQGIQTDSRWQTKHFIMAEMAALQKRRASGASGQSGTGGSPRGGA